MKKLLAIYASLVSLVLVFSLSASADTITVEKGDSMWEIAKRYNVPFAKVLELNKSYANQHLIFPGDKIIIPDGSAGVGTPDGSDKDNIAESDETAPPHGHGVSTQAEAVLLLVNNERAKHGLKALSLSENLTSIATMKAKDMAVNAYFSHDSPTYGSPFQMLQKFGVSYKSAGENIAAGQKTAQEVMNGWMNSSGHRANILNAKYTEIGVGYFPGGSYGVYWTQIFIGK